MRTHRVAVVGCGAFARGWHLPNIRDNPRIELAVTCDADLPTAQECARAFNAARAVDDWREVVDDPAVDVIVLATHTNLRGELIVPALRAGKPVYVEKPLAETDAEMLEIVQATRQTGVPVCVGHNRRSSPAVLDLRRLLDQARRGPGGWLPSVDRSESGRRDPIPQEHQVQVLIRVNDDCRSWKDWVFDEPGGVLLAEMVHFVDLALWLNPSPPVRVFAEGSPVGNFTLLIRFADGSLTTIQHTLAGHFDYPKELIEVTTGHVTLAMEHHLELRQRGLTDEPFRRTYPIPHQPLDPSLPAGIEGSGRAPYRPSDCGLPQPAGTEGSGRAPYRPSNLASPRVAGPDGLGTCSPSQLTIDSSLPAGIEAFHHAVTAAFEKSRQDGSAPTFISPDKGHAAHLDRFLDHIEGRGENPCDVVDAVIVTRVTLKLLESIRQGLPLPVASEELHV